MKIRAVLDTSSLISIQRHALVYPAAMGYYTIVWSPFLIAEFTRIRTELAIRHGQDRALYRTRINEYIKVLSQLAVTVDHTRLEGGNYTRWLHDPDDEPVLATALVGKAQFIVSLNTKDFPPNSSFAGVHYMTPAKFLELLYEQNPQKDLQAQFDESDYRLP